jgi:hypothetical protein
MQVCEWSRRATCMSSADVGMWLTFLLAAFVVCRGEVEPLGGYGVCYHGPHNPLCMREAATEVSHPVVHYSYSCQVAVLTPFG